MRTTPRLAFIAGTAAVALLVLAGCSSSSGTTSGNSTKGIRVAYAGDLDPNDIADQLGIKSAGAVVTSLNDDTNVVNGVQKGSFELGNVDTASAIQAIQAGIPIKIVYVSQNLPEFVMISQPDITQLSQLAGKTVAYDSEGSETETLEKQLVQQAAPSIVNDVKWTALANSPNRAAAMVAHRLDATTVEYADLLAIQKKATFNVLGNWSNLKGQSSDAIATVWITSTKYLDANRGKVTAFLKDLQTGYDTTYSDKSAWLAVATKTLPRVNATDLGTTYDYYTKSGMYPKSGTPPITSSRWVGLDQFYRENGQYTKKATVDQMVDLKLVAAVNG
jgi:ABC-type nitrate/sulfonate/bicarbonate transport system substrate-binding protein